MLNKTEEQMVDSIMSMSLEEIKVYSETLSTENPFDTLQEMSDAIESSEVE